VIDHKALTYLVNKSNPNSWFTWWLLIMEEFDIIHCPKRWHGNVDGFIRAYEGVSDVSKDDDFPNASIMRVNAKGAFEEYQ
jgi:hypothetical protein